MIKSDITAGAVRDSTDHTLCALLEYQVPGLTHTGNFRMVGQKANGKWRDVIANGSTVQ